MRCRDFKLNDTSWNAIQYNDSKQNDIQQMEAKTMTYGWSVKKMWTKMRHHDFK